MDFFVHLRHVERNVICTITRAFSVSLNHSRAGRLKVADRTPSRYRTSLTIFASSNQTRILSSRCSPSAAPLVTARRCMCRGTCAILKALQKCTEHAKPARATNARQFFLLDSPQLNITRAGRVAPVQILLALIFSASSYSIYTPRRRLTFHDVLL